MMDDGVTFGGVHCSAVGLEVMDSRRPLFAESKDQYVDVPYKDGSVHIPDNSKLDIEIEIDFFLNKVQGKTFHEACRAVSEWLDTVQRQDLVFDDDPNFIYHGKPIGRVDKEQIAEFGTFTVVFRCLP